MAAIITYILNTELKGNVEEFICFSGVVKEDFAR